MSDDHHPVRSRLKSPVRGVGSAYPQNQALAGAQDPREAARIAAMDPAEASRLEEEHAAASASLDNKRTELLTAYSSGDWTPPVHLKDGETVDMAIRAATPPYINQWYGEYKAHLETSAEEELEAAAVASGIRGVFTVGPDDPNYDPITDHERRKRIEELLDPLDFADLVFTGAVRQTIPLQDGPKGAITATFTSMPTKHAMWLQFMAGKELRESTTQHANYSYSLWQVATTLVEFAGRTIEPALDDFLADDQYEQFAAALKTRMKLLERMPSELTNDLIVQNTWFALRIRKLVIGGNLVERVGNS